MESYHLIKMKPTKTYLSLVDPNKKSRVVCLNNNETADTFVNYVSAFRSKHGHWPNMDMSKRISTVKSKVEFKKRTSDEIKRFLDVDTFDYEQIETMVKRTNISFICVCNFSYLENEETHQIISFSGQEWDGKADEILYRDLLEFNLKTK